MRTCMLLRAEVGASRALGSGRGFPRLASAAGAGAGLPNSVSSTLQLSRTLRYTCLHSKRTLCLKIRTDVLIPKHVYKFEGVELRTCA